MALCYDFAFLGERKVKCIACHWNILHMSAEQWDGNLWGISGMG